LRCDRRARSEYIFRW